MSNRPQVFVPLIGLVQSEDVFYLHENPSESHILVTEKAMNALRELGIGMHFGAFYEAHGAKAAIDKSKLPFSSEQVAALGTALDKAGTAKWLYTPEPEKREGGWLSRVLGGWKSGPDKGR